MGLRFLEDNRGAAGPVLEFPAVYIANQVTEPEGVAIDETVFPYIGIAAQLDQQIVFLSLRDIGPPAAEPIVVGSIVMRFRSPEFAFSST